MAFAAASVWQPLQPAEAKIGSPAAGSPSTCGAGCVSVAWVSVACVCVSCVDVSVVVVPSWPSASSGSRASRTMAEEHRDHEERRDGDERAEPPARVVRVARRQDERRHDREQDERPGDGDEPELLRCREADDHGSATYQP